MKQAKLVIYRSRNGRDSWEPVMPDAVPQWVTHPDVMGRLVQNEMCMDPTRGNKGSSWYRAVKVENIH